MRIAVIGAGIIGITSAYEFARDGHEVTVFDRHSAAAEESSFANAGVVAPGYVTPWAAPGMPFKVLRHLLSAHGPVGFGSPLGLNELGWMWRWWRACNAQKYTVNRTRMQQLAFFSRQRLHHLVHDLRLDYDRSQGMMVLLRNVREVHQAQVGLDLLRELGVTFQLLEPSTARTIEPALNADTPFLQAIHLPDEEVGNCRQFALLLKEEAQQLGCEFRFQTQVLEVKAGTQPSVLHQHRNATAPSEHSFDAVVVCAGNHGGQLLRPLGLRLPILPVYGRSVTLAVREPLDAPQGVVMDERYKVAISRLGQRVRVAGGAQIGGRPGIKDKDGFATLYKVLYDWFPSASKRGKASHGSLQTQEWVGARPMMPDGPPLLGPSGVPGVWLNLGHGSSGWALSCGSARVLADQIGGGTPAIDTAGFSVERLRH